MQHLLSPFRRAVDEFQMIKPGDRIAVGVSGGKDSLAVLRLAKALQRFYPAPFHLEAITLDMGMDGMDFSPISEFCKELDIPYSIEKTDIKEIVFDIRKEKNPCSMCAKMRRGALNQAILEQGFTKVALGHHYDDAVETFLMSLIFEGRISCFQPVTYLDRSGVTQIRPLLYLTEGMVRRLAEEEQLPIVQNRCPADKNTKREEIKELIRSLSKTYPELKERVFGAMQRLPLPEWGTVPHQRTSGK